MSAGKGGTGRGDGQHKYQVIPSGDEECLSISEDSNLEGCEQDQHSSPEVISHLKKFRKRNEKRVGLIIMAAIGMILFLYWAVL